MKTKRSSTRFKVTREGGQLDPRSGVIPATMKVHPIPCTSGDNPKYRLELENATGNICDLDSLEEEFMSKAALHLSTVNSVVNAIFDILPRYIAQTGRSVRIGNLVTLKPFVTGTIDHANDEPDPDANHLEIRATVSPALRHSLAKAKVVNVNARAHVIDRVICEKNGARVDEIYPDCDIRFVGFGSPA